MFEHLEEVKMSYCEHFRRSFVFGGKFFIAGFKACVHSFYPDIFQTSTTDMVEEMSKIL